MSTIQEDVGVYPYSKVFRYENDGVSDDRYLASAYYSFVMDLFDEPGYMAFPTPMKYNTPTSFTMLNGWMNDNGDGSNLLKYIYGGSIDTSGYTDDVLMVDVDNLTDFVTTDKDLTVRETTDIGPLLAYKNNYDESGEGRLWIRDVAAHGQIDNNDTVEVTTAGGSGTCLAMANSVTGDEIYANLYTLEDFPGSPDPQVYVFQNHPQSGVSVRIEEWSNTDSWDRGGIDVLIPVKLGGALIDTGVVRVFVRQSGDTFTYGIVDLSSGSRTPVSTETAADAVNVTEGEHYLMYDTQTTNFSAGDVIQNVSTDSVTPPSWYAEVVANTLDQGTDGVIEVRGLRGAPADDDSIFVGTTDCADVVGTVGDTYAKWDAETTAPVAGDLGKPVEGATSGAQRVLRAYIDNGDNTGLLVMQVYHTHGTLDLQDYTGSGRDVLYKALADNDVLSAPASGASLVDVTIDDTFDTIISGYSDVTVAHINGTIVADTFVGTFTEGERVTWSGGGPAIVVKTNGSTEITLANVEDETNLDVDSVTVTGDISGATCDTSGTGGMTDENTELYAFDLQGSYNYSVFVEGGSIYQAGRSLANLYSYLQYLCRDGNADVFYTSDGSTIAEAQKQEYIRADSGYAASKPAPFGTLAGGAGGTFFGAVGVWLEGMASADNNNIKLLDVTNTLRTPYISVDVTVGNTRVSDVITVFLEEGSSGLPKTDQYVSHATANVQGDGTLEQDAASPLPGLPNDTPTTGTVFVKDNGVNETHRYRYSSWDNTGGTGDDGKLTLATSDAGLAEGGSTGQTLIDTGVFDDCQKGDIIRRTNGSGGWAYILSVDSVDQVTTTVLSAGSGWAGADTFETNLLVETYDGSDTFYIPYLDVIEDTGTEGSPGSATESLTFVSPRAVVIRVRNVEGATPIQPFVTTSDITTTGMNVSAVRNEDEVYA